MEEWIKLIHEENEKGYGVETIARRLSISPGALRNWLTRNGYVPRASETKKEPSARVQSIMKDLKEGEQTPSEIAAKHKVSLQAVYQIRHRRL